MRMLNTLLLRTLYLSCDRFEVEHVGGDLEECVESSPFLVEKVQGA